MGRTPALVLIMAVELVVFLDTTVVNIDLPRIGASLHLNEAGLARSRSPQPLMPLRLFRVRNVTGSTIVNALVGATACPRTPRFGTSHSAASARRS
jgi:hypothetical protein